MIPARAWRWLFNREAQAWERRIDSPEHREYMDERIAVIAAALPARCSILDLGCGPGNYAALLAPRGYDVIGIDSAPKMVERANARDLGSGAGTVHAQVGDLAEPLPFADHAFAGALSVASLQFVPDPSALLHEVARVLQPGGVLLICAPPRVRTAPPTGNAYWRVRYALSRIPGTMRVFTIDEVIGLVRDAGFATAEGIPLALGTNVLARR
jgi:SAM-dependent methyltransferase